MQINLINGEGAEHDIGHRPVQCPVVAGDRPNASSTFSFLADKPGEFAYFCTVAGHRAAGMEGLVQVVAGPRAAAVGDAADIVRDPGDLPSPIGTRQPEVVKVDARDHRAQGQARRRHHLPLLDLQRQGARPVRARPGRRHRGGDAEEPRRQLMMHNVDFHAVTGPGGGARATQAEPGERRPSPSRR